MKRLIAAVAIALCTAPAFADVGAPFEQTELDRALPAVPENLAAYEPISSDRMPFEQTRFDRGDLGTPEHVQLAQIGGMSYKSGTEENESVWANDHSFVAPPQ
jgi:hypothetical protein